MSKWQKWGQGAAVLAVVFGGLFVINALPNPAWETDRLAESSVALSIGLEKNWDDAYVGRLGASDVEKWDLVPRGWVRSGNGWRVGRSGERFEVGTWKENDLQKGFALIYRGVKESQCKELSRLMEDAFDQLAVNGKGKSCSQPENLVVFYRNPG